jgi:hypothetical protein
MPGVKRRKPVRRPWGVAAAARPRAAEPTAAETAESADQANLLRRVVHCSITGSQASEASTMSLHYGPSSTFVFLQQLHRFLFGEQTAKQTTISGRSTNYTAEAISEFGYSPIFFGKDTDGPMTTSAQQQQEIPAAFAPEMLSFDLAATFLEMYLSTIHHVFLFCEPTTLRKLFYNLYSEPANSPNNLRDSTMVMATLAIGAGLTNHPVWADSLYRKVTSRLNSWGDAASLRSVQISILLSEYHQGLGRPNSSMLAIGRGVQQAFAVGLHRDMPSQDSKSITEADRCRLRERQSTFWSLYARDRNLSLCLGRPASINDLDIDIPDPSWDHRLLATVALSRLSYKVYYTLYGRNRGSITAFCRKVQDLYDDLLAFHRALPADLKFPFTEAELNAAPAHMTTAMMVLTFHFFQTLTIVLRPCVVLDTARRHTPAPPTSTPPLVPPSCALWLADACARLRRASIQIISIFSLAIETNSFMSCMRHSRFFIEGACFSLLFDVVRDPTREDCAVNFQGVAEGLRCFTRLPTDRLLMISTLGVTQILRLTEELVRVARGEGTSQDAISRGVQTEARKVQATAEAPAEAALAGAAAPVFGGVDAGVVSDDFFNNNIFDMSYYLWCEDPGSLGVD